MSYRPCPSDHWCIPQPSAIHWIDAPTITVFLIGLILGMLFTVALTVREYNRRDRGDHDEHGGEP